MARATSIAPGRLTFRTRSVHPAAPDHNPNTRPLREATVPDHDDAQVTYPVRDLLSQIRNEQTAGFARIETSMASKADKADIERLESRLDHHAKDIGDQAQAIADLRQWKRDRETAASVHVQRDQRTFTTRQKIGAGIGSVCLLLATILGPYLGAHGL